LLTEGWKAFGEITTPFKFKFSAILRVISGNFGIMSTIVLVMYSTEVVDLLLNFTAMEFVATLDGSAFEIASKGFLGITLEKKAKEIQEFRYKRRTKKGSSATRVFAYTFYVCAVFGAFIIVVYYQSQRAIGVDNEVYVQFDDTHVPELSGISGVYKGCRDFQTRRTDKKGTRMTGAIGYVDISFHECPTVSKAGEFPGQIFVYCWEHDGWVFIPKTTKQPCDEGGYLLRSFLDHDNRVDSNSFDILTHSKANWLVNRPRIGGQVLLDFVFIESVQRFDFTFKNCSGGLHLTNSSGAILDFEPLPNTETFYPFFEDKKGGGSKSYIDAFGLLYRQVFRLKPESRNQNEESQVVLYDGLRWVAMHLNPLHFATNISKTSECPPEEDDPECWIVFLKYFHMNSMWMSNITGDFAGISDPMKVLTPEDTGVPTNELKWFVPQFIASDGHVLPGKTEVFTYNRLECAVDLSSVCSKDGTPMVLELTTDSFPSENAVLAFYGQNVQAMQDFSNTPEVITAVDDLQTEFTILENTLTTFLFPDSQAAYRLSTCLPDEDRCLQLVVLDSYGDGLESPGQYAVAYGEAFVFGSGADWTCRSYHLGPNCNEQQSPDPFNCTYAGVRDTLYPGDLLADTG
jgi:hypothetical protein